MAFAGRGCMGKERIVRFQLEFQREVDE